MSVELQFSESGSVLRARRGTKSDLVDVATCQGDAVVWRDRRTFRLPADAHCVTYEALMTGLESRFFKLPSGLSAFSPSQFMWLPALEAEDHVVVTVTGAERVSLPWVLLEDGRWQIPASPHSNQAVALFGGHAFNLPGVNQPAVLAGSARHIPKLKRWLSDNLRVAEGVSHAQIVLVPSKSRQGRSPVPFGDVIRDQGETVRFFVDPDRSLRALNEDWTAAHELAHLRLPYIDKRWVSEGFASYYQNVLQARRGEYSERRAWRKLLTSFRQAAEEGKSMTPNQTDARSFWQARMLIYWSGAALALHADVVLRQQGSSLDAVLNSMQTCCLPAAHAYTPVQLFKKLDTLHGRAVFMPLYRQFADTRGMPPFEKLFIDLGARPAGSDIRLRDDAPLASIRRQIMQPRQPLR